MSERLDRDVVDEVRRRRRRRAGWSSRVDDGRKRASSSIVSMGARPAAHVVDLVAAADLARSRCASTRRANGHGPKRCARRPSSTNDGIGVYSPVDRARSRSVGFGRRRRRAADAARDLARRSRARPRICSRRGRRLDPAHERAELRPRRARLGVEGLERRARAPRRSGSARPDRARARFSSTSKRPGGKRRCASRSASMRQSRIARSTASWPLPAKSGLPRSISARTTAVAKRSARWSNGLARDLLGREVRELALEHRGSPPCAASRGSSRARDAEVAELHPPVGRQVDVRRA